MEEAIPGEIHGPLVILIAMMRKIVAVMPQEKKRILVIDDDPNICHLLKLTLAAPNREIIGAGTAADAEALLAEHKFALVILDLILPDMDGRNFLMRLRERETTETVPIIVVSARSGQHQKTECFALGADDYIEKPFDTAVLAAIVSAKLQRADEITRELREDSLTGLLNRNGLREAFSQTLLLTLRTKMPLAVAILDLDHFKAVNDAHGHAMGDEVLRRSASVLSGTFRKSDLIGRWGGEEFVVLFPNTEPHGALQALNKAQAALSEVWFAPEKGEPFHITFSAGAVAISDNASMEEVVAWADHNLYAAKSAGRNRVVVTDQKIASKRKRVLVVEENDEVASVVRHRLEREGLEVLHFQNGTEALEAASRMDFSLAVLDVKIPGMDGFELLCQLRKLSTFKDIPILMLTSMGREADVVRGFDLGADDYILKPCSPVELLARIRRHLIK